MTGFAKGRKVVLENIIKNKISVILLITLFCISFYAYYERQNSISLLKESNLQREAISKLVNLNQESIINKKELLNTKEELKNLVSLRHKERKKLIQWGISPRLVNQEDIIVSLRDYVYRKTTVGPGRFRTEDPISHLLDLDRWIQV